MEAANALRTAVGPRRESVLAKSVRDLLAALAVAVDVAADADEASREMKPLRVAAVGKAGRGVAASALATAEPSALLVSGVTPVPTLGRGMPAGLRSVCRQGGIVSILTAWRNRPFGERDAAVLGLLHPQVAWAIAAPASGLPAATAGVLELMLAGLPEKEIARRLGRSTHTVHAHVKRVYRHYEVSSRSQLIVRHFVTEPSDEPSEA